MKPDTLVTLSSRARINQVQIATPLDNQSLTTPVMSSSAEHTVIGANTDKPLKIPRIITGLWQLAGGHDAEVDIGGAAKEMGKLVQRGLTAFDMADRM